MPVYLSPHNASSNAESSNAAKEGEVDVPTASPVDSAPIPSPAEDSPDTPMPTSTPIASIPASLRKTAYRPWELWIGLGIVATVSVARAAASFPELTGLQFLTHFSRSISSFLINNVITVVYSVETGFIEGLCDSIWPLNPPGSLGVCVFFVSAHCVAKLVSLSPCSGDTSCTCPTIRMSPFHLPCPEKLPNLSLLFQLLLLPHV